MKTPQLFHVDAFTRVAFRGNSAGVVLDADGMSPAQMQALARELKHSETAFVLAPEDASHEVRIRYFTPTTEVPVCGHATIAAHYARAMALGLGETELRQKTGAGIQSIRIERAQGDYRVVMRQGAVEFGVPLAPDLRQEIANALGMTAHDLLPGAPLQVVSTGHSKVMVPIQLVNTLDALAPNHEALTALSARIGCNGYFPFVVDSVERATYGRMFAPAIGIPEDPVTGNANGPLGAYLVRHRLMPHDGRCFAFTGHQGRAIGHDGEVHVEVTVHEGEPVQVTIKGDAVLLFSAALRL